MSDEASPASPEPPVETPEVVGLAPAAEDAEAGADTDDDPYAIEEPAKIMRIGSMIKQLLEELRTTDLDPHARVRLRDIYERSIVELGTSLSPALCDELARLTSDFADDETPSEAELRMAKAQLVGWLEGLFQGIQATLISQQMAARQQLERMRHQLPPGQMPQPGQGGGGPPPGMPAAEGGERPGTYL
ncbi:MAG: proteasome activator [Acidimicrobiales bacterium]